MRRLSLTTVLMLATALAVAPAPPAVARPAAQRSGVVLTVAARGGMLQLVDSSHLVRAYRLRGPAAVPGAASDRRTMLRPGVVIAYREIAGTIADVRVIGRARRVAYYASVVRVAPRRLVLELADGARLALAGARPAAGSRRGLGSGVPVLAHAARVSARTDVTIEVSGLVRGATVLVTETISATGTRAFSVAAPRIADVPDRARATRHARTTGDRRRRPHR